MQLISKSQKQLNQATLLKQAKTWLSTIDSDDVITEITGFVRDHWLHFAEHNDDHELAAAWRYEFEQPLQFSLMYSIKTKRFYISEFNQTNDGVCVLADFVPEKAQTLKQIIIHPRDFTECTTGLHQIGQQLVNELINKIDAEMNQA